MHISYIIFMVACLAASVGLQLFIRKKLLELLHVERWIESEFKGDLSDITILEDWIKEQINRYKVRLVLRSGWITFGLIVVLSAFSVLPSFFPSLGIVMGFYLLNMLASNFAISPFFSDFDKVLEEYLNNHQFDYILNHLDDSKKIYKMLDNATHQEAKKLIQAFKDTGRTHHIPQYLKKLLNSFIFENQLMGLEHLYLATPEKELELLIFAYNQEAGRFKGDRKNTVDPSEYQYRFLYHLVPNKLQYEKELLTRIISHPEIKPHALIHLAADGLGQTLIRLLPITPLKLALSNHPILASIGYERLTNEELEYEILPLMESYKNLSDISRWVTGVAVFDSSAAEKYRIVYTPHERVLELAQSNILDKEGMVYKRLMKVLGTLGRSKINQYYCKTCGVKSDIFKYEHRNYPICPVCKRLDGLEVSLSFPLIVGVIGLTEYTIHPEKNEIHIPIWNEAERKALHTKIEVLEIWEAENLSYDWAVNAVVNVQLNLQPDVRLRVRLVGNPPLSQNSRLILKIP